MALQARKRTAVLIVLTCFLHNLLVSLSREFLRFYFISKKTIQAQQLLELKWPPDYWLAVGSAGGCLLGALLFPCCGKKAALNLMRPLLLFWPIIYYLSDYSQEDISQHRTTLLTIAFILQGILDTISMIGIPLYILETVCDQSCSRLLTPILLVATQLPWRTAKVILQSIVYFSKYLLVYEIGFISLFVLVQLLSFFSPGYRKADYQVNGMSTKHVQKGGDCLRPLLVCSGIVLLTQLSGSDIYHFYSYWSFRPVLTEYHRLITMSVILLTCIFLTTLSALFEKGPKFIGWMATLTTLVASVCLFASGWIIQSTRYPYWLPLALYMTFNIIFHLGLGSLYIPACAFLLGPNQTAVFTVVAFLHTTVGLLLSGGATTILVDFLQPFGVFWLHSTLTFIGFLYLALTVAPQLSFLARERREITLIEEFVTQV